MNANTFLSQDEQKSIEQKIAEAESRTGAEFVCAIATESGRYDRAEGIWGLIFSLIFLALAYANPVDTFGLSSASGEWGAELFPGLLWLTIAVVIGFIVGNVLASNAYWLRGLLVSENEMEEETRRAASHVFALRQLSATENSRGVLIYLSLFERRVVILADKGALVYLTQSDVDKLCSEAVGKLRQGEGKEMFLTTIDAAADLLAPGLTPDEDEVVNELSNELALFHPRP